MKIEIQADGTPARKDLQHFVKCRADLALKVLQDQISLVSVFVDDTGEGIRCLVLIRSSTQTDVLIESHDANLYVAIHRAVYDAGWTLAHSLMRQQSNLLQRQFEIIEGHRPQSWPGAFVESDRAA